MIVWDFGIVLVVSQILSTMVNESLRSKILSFRCEEYQILSGPTHRISKKQRSNSTRTQNVKENGVLNGKLQDLPPSVPTDSLLMFVGFNPGVKSSIDQHHYAHGTNLFWKLFNALLLFENILQIRQVDISKDKFLREEVFIDGVCKLKPTHDYSLANYGVGFTDLCLRCTKQANELTLQEKMSNVPRLFSEFASSKARYIVIVGKGIWEIIMRYVGCKLMHGLDFSWGLQRCNKFILAIYRICKYEPAIYVFPNTSGLVALMKYGEKLNLWCQLAIEVGGQGETSQEERNK